VDIVALENQAGATAVDGGNRRVLIVGDPPLGRGLLRTMLSRLDYAVTWTAAARDADIALNNRQFALVLVALQLPDISGLAFARRLAESRGRRGGLPIIVFGEAWDMGAVRRECQQAGVEAYLPKPISFTRLMAVIRDLTQADPPMAASPAIMSMGKEHIDTARFASFTQGDPQLARELGALFVSTALDYLREMERLRQEGSDWSRAAHALKGASANIGAVALASLAAEAERARPSAAMLAQLHTAFAAAQAFFQPTDDGPASDPA
jgi:two-component system sensor histidine kinase/response regulator